MRLFFSEYKSDYSNYIFPYAIWAVPEGHETPADLFARGFLPNSPNLDRFYMCRNVRVDLKDFVPSSENRRILRKGERFRYRLLRREDFEYTQEWRDFCLDYAEQKFGPDVMTPERLDQLFDAPIVSHVLLFHDPEREKDIGLVMLYLEEPMMGFYYFSFYDLDYFKNSLGMFMMTTAVRHLQQLGFEFIYLGSCYSRNALYKTQFEGAEFFNGFRWSRDLDELKFLIQRDSGQVDKHLLENADYLNTFYPPGIPGLSFESIFKMNTK